MKNATLTELMKLMSQAEIARRLYVSASTINRWHMGHTKPSHHFRKQLARLLADQGIRSGRPENRRKPETHQA